MPFTYKVLPFIGTINKKQTSSDVSGQLQNLINTQAEKGWELDQIGNVNIEVKPGCLLGLFGAKAEYTRYDMVIFKRPD